MSIKGKRTQRPPLTTLWSNYSQPFGKACQDHWPCSCLTFERGSCSPVHDRIFATTHGHAVVKTYFKGSCHCVKRSMTRPCMSPHLEVIQFPWIQKEVRLKTGTVPQNPMANHDLPIKFIKLACLGMFRVYWSILYTGGPYFQTQQSGLESISRCNGCWPGSFSCSVSLIEVLCQPKQ